MAHPGATRHQTFDNLNIDGTGNQDGLKLSGSMLFSFPTPPLALTAVAYQAAASTSSWPATAIVSITI
jgi:hypothetical protein